MDRALAIGVFALALLLGACHDGETPAQAATAPSEAPPVSAEHRAEVEAWRAQRHQRLTTPDGWLTLVGLAWLGEGRSRLGSAADAEVPFPASAPARLAEIERRGDRLTLYPAPGVELRAGEQPVAGPTPLASDLDGDPTEVRHGSFVFYVIQRGDRWAVRVKDSESPVRTGFQGLEYFPLRADWRVEARLERAPPGTTIPVPNILGSVDDSPSPGAVVFGHAGQQVRLAAIDEGDGRLFLVFGDATNGKTTYGGGRFVYADPPPPGSDRVVVDFNKAYNPPCVFTHYSTCPLPPRGNHIAAPVEAGERLWSGHHAPPG